MIPAETSDPIVCFASKEYVPLFAELTRAVHTEKAVFYNAAVPPPAPGCRLIRFETTTRTNWQYECATAFLDGNIPLSVDSDAHSRGI
jgi:hypothetical protein